MSVTDDNDSEKAQDTGVKSYWKGIVMDIFLKTMSYKITVIIWWGPIN